MADVVSLRWCGAPAVGCCAVYHLRYCAGGEEEEGRYGELHVDGFLL